MGKMDALVLRSKFRGSILGLLMGDCLGSAYEGEEIFTAGMKLVIQKSFDKLEGPHYKAPVIQFTDDSAMAHSVAKSLIQCRGFDPNDMAKKFVKSYYQEPNRGYGPAVTTVFEKLRKNKFNDILGPAREQFNGQGSLGNGGAMRVAPVALFCQENFQRVVDIAGKQSMITHTHKNGINGAILQAIAVHQSLSLNPEEVLDTSKFADDLIGKMDKIEVDDDGLGLDNPSPYKSQLKLVKELISEGGDGPHDEKVVHLLGNDVSALHSVPTAIYCFLRAYRPVKNIQTENQLRRTIQYAKLNDDEVLNVGKNYCRNGFENIFRDDHTRLTYPGNLKRGGNYSRCKYLRGTRNRSSGIEEEKEEEEEEEEEEKETEEGELFPVDLNEPEKARISNWNNPESSNLYNYQYGVVFPFLNGSDSSPPFCRFDFSRNSNFSNSFDDSTTLGKSPPTIVCPKRSSNTCTAKINVTECGVQWIESSAREESSSPTSCNISSVERETRDTAVTVEYDAYDIFAKTIAGHLRAMDVETALRAQDQIEKVITDHRLHKPETISLGGDTDTIGSMAGAIAGAFYGDELIKPEILRHCESSSEFKELADQLYDLATVQQSNADN